MSINATEIMNRSIEAMMDEHRLIGKVLSSLATFAEQLEGGQERPREAVARYATCFREFADRCHHGREEERLCAQLDASCRAYADVIVGTEKIEELKSLAQELLSRYPLHPEVPGAAHRCTGCGAH